MSSFWVATRSCYLVATTVGSCVTSLFTQILVLLQITHAKKHTLYLFVSEYIFFFTARWEPIDAADYYFMNVNNLSK